MQQDELFDLEPTARPEIEAQNFPFAANAMEMFEMATCIDLAYAVDRALFVYRWQGTESQRAKDEEFLKKQILAKFFSDASFAAELSDGSLGVHDVLREAIAAICHQHHLGGLVPRRSKCRVPDNIPDGLT